jgi:hypothetical protein
MLYVFVLFHKKGLGYESFFGSKNLGKYAKTHRYCRAWSDVWHPNHFQRKIFYSKIAQK